MKPSTDKDGRPLLHECPLGVIYGPLPGVSHGEEVERHALGLVSERGWDAWRRLLDQFGDAAELRAHVEFLEHEVVRLSGGKPEGEPPGARMPRPEEGSAGSLTEPLADSRAREQWQQAGRFMQSLMNEVRNTVAELIKARLRKPATHDLTRADYAFRPINDGQRGHIACWNATTPGMKPRPGDYLILRNENDTTRYQVVTLDPCRNVDPPTMWMADLTFAPRP